MSSKKTSQSGKAKSVVKNGSGKSEKKASFSPASIIAFIQEVQTEFKKVVWPQKKVTLGLTAFVLVLVVIISSYLGLVDLLIGKVVASIIG